MNVRRLKLPTARIYIFLGALVVTGMFIVWYSTVWGAGLISDSFQYTASARNFAVGNGFTIPYGDGELEPMTKYPPMFPILLAAFELVGIKALLGARIANIILFGINIILVFVCTQRLTRSNSFALLISLLFSVSFVMVEVHSWALSEPLYICLGLIAFLVGERYFETRSWRWLMFLGLVVACAFLTRYVGFSLVVACAAIIFFLEGSLWKRFAETLLFGILSVLPTAIWTARGYLLTRTLNDRLVGFHPLTNNNYANAIDTIFGWFLPAFFLEGKEKLLLILCAVIFIGAIVLLRFNRGVLQEFLNKPVSQLRTIALHVIYTFIFGIMIIVSKTWVDPDIGMSNRILSPMSVSLLILSGVLLQFLWETFKKARFVVVAICVWLIAYYGVSTMITIQPFHNNGIGIARKGWYHSEVIQSLQSYSQYSIYTNSNSSLYLWTGRSGYELSEFRALKEQGTNREVLLVIFHQVPPTGQTLDKLVSGLKLVNEDRLISIYSFGPSQ
jgi:4-amino-4-deoxy-L-arabinose transferase-like glycosyltransferase